MGDTYYTIEKDPNGDFPYARSQILYAVPSAGCCSAVFSGAVSIPLTYVYPYAVRVYIQKLNAVCIQAGVTGGSLRLTQHVPSMLFDMIKIPIPAVPGDTIQVDYPQPLKVTDRLQLYVDNTGGHLGTWVITINGFTMGY